MFGTGSRCLYQGQLHCTIIFVNFYSKDKEHGHILTGGLKVGDYIKLRKLLTKELKCSQNMSIDFKEARSELLSSLLEKLYSLLKPFLFRNMKC